MFSLDDFNIILASQSPRRQTLLKELGINFITKSADIDESFSSNLVKEEIPLFLANAKAEAMQTSLKTNDILITADTIVWLGERAINKPKDRSDAFEMISELSGNCHTVYTGVQLTNLQKKVSFFSETKVFFSELEASEINYYLDTFKPYDKAGAYGIQEWIGYVGVERIEGSYFNVMGFPVHQVYQQLKQFIFK